MLHDSAFTVFNELQIINSQLQRRISKIVVFLASSASGSNGVPPWLLAVASLMETSYFVILFIFVPIWQSL